jgi:hypothetical protein
VRASEELPAFGEGSGNDWKALSARRPSPARGELWPEEDILRSYQQIAQVVLLELDVILREMIACH